MKGMHWVVIKSGDVVESTGEPQFASGYRNGCSITYDYKVVEVKRVSSGAFLGTRKLDNLRPAMAHEVAMAKEGRR